MNIIFEKIEAQNFKSIGPLTTLEFNNFNGLVYVYGENRDINDNSNTRNGVGKCLHPDTKINIEVLDEQTKQKLLTFLNIQINNKHLTITIKDVVDFYQQYPEELGKLLVETPYGYKVIEHAQKTDHSIPMLIQTESNNTCISSINHRYKINDTDFEYAKNLKIGDYILGRNGKECIIDIKHFNKPIDLYDLQVAEVRQYYANNLVSHNSVLFVDCIMFALFGQTLMGTSMPFIPNRYIDKSIKTFVKLYFSVDGIHYCCECFLKPSKTSVGFSILKILSDGSVEDLTPPSTIRAKKFIQEQLLKCNIDVFKSSIIISASDVVDFYSLRADKKRSYIESVFNLNLFGDMFNMIKSDYNSVKKEIAYIQNELVRSNNILIEFTEKYNNYEAENNKKIEDRKQKMITNYKKLNDTKDQLSKLQDNVKDYDKLISEIKDVINKIKTHETSIQKLNLSETTLSTENKSNNKVVKKVEQIRAGLCEKCTDIINQKFDVDEYTKKINTNNLKIEAIKTTIKQFNDKLQKLSDQLDDLNKQKENLDSINSKIRMLNQDINYLSNELNDMKTSYANLLKEKENNPFTETINEANKNIEQNKTSYKEYNKNMIHLDILKEISSENGVKRIMIKDIVKLLNNLIQKYLTEIGSEYILLFDESFNFKCLTPGGECEFSSFSAGERQRIQIATLFSFRDLITNGKINSNILIIDELLDSFIDGSALKNILSILTKKIIEHNQKIFIISHRTEALDENIFSNIIKVIKHNGVSEIEVR